MDEGFWYVRGELPKKFVKCMSDLLKCINSESDREKRAALIETAVAFLVSAGSSSVYEALGVLEVVKMNMPLVWRAVLEEGHEG